MSTPRKTCAHDTSKCQIYVPDLGTYNEYLIKDVEVNNAIISNSQIISSILRNCTIYGNPTKIIKSELINCTYTERVQISQSSLVDCKYEASAESQAFGFFMFIIFAAAIFSIVRGNNR